MCGDNFVLYLYMCPSPVLLHVRCTHSYAGHADNFSCPPARPPPFFLRDYVIRLMLKAKRDAEAAAEAAEKDTAAAGDEESGSAAAAVAE